MHTAPLSLAAAACILSAADAFAPATTSRARVSIAVQAASAKPLTELCEITKEACDAVSPMLLGKWKICCFKFCQYDKDNSIFRSFMHREYLRHRRDLVR